MGWLFGNMNMGQIRLRNMIHEQGTDILENNFWTKDISVLEIMFYESGTYFWGEIRFMNMGQLLRNMIYENKRDKTMGNNMIYGLWRIDTQKYDLRTCQNACLSLFCVSVTPQKTLTGGFKAFTHSDKA